MIDINSSELVLFMAVLLSAFATFLTRAFPFYLIKTYKQNAYLKAIQKHMGIMIMVILVFYALKDTKLHVYPYGANEAIAILTLIIIHLKFRNALLSIVTSTAFYMFLTRTII
ncbi:hypothetical protein LMG7974_01814 [Campylobacter majalis]|uniref:Branched-chain amino acid ABC transporter n=1 Tax=Campylobacter majalis TaxID=2790656 RepID=A0ABM8QA53_9BACT|nr:AzlD domain-containing protein [Campylobacter majalis]CAD7289736.1 hypothetical protein LMG7974_01814 [Campylobacter majalis]